VKASDGGRVESHPSRRRVGGVCGYVKHARHVVSSLKHPVVHISPWIIQILVHNFQCVHSRPWVHGSWTERKRELKSVATLSWGLVLRPSRLGHIESLQHMHQMAPTSTSVLLCSNCKTSVDIWSTETQIDLLDAEIARRLEAMIVPLRRRRNSLLPMFRLPEELMQLIISFTASQGNEEALRYSDLLTVSQVCYAWRHVTLANKRNWSDIHITYPYLATLFLSRSAPHPIHLSWIHTKSEEILTSMDGFEERVNAFKSVLRHAERIASIHIHMPFEDSEFELHLLPILSSVAPMLTHLRSFSADFSGYPDGRLVSLDECFKGGATKLTHLRLLHCQVSPSIVASFSHLRSLYLPDVWSLATISAQEWRDALVLLSPTLEVLRVDTQYLGSFDSLSVDLKLMDKLTLRGSIPKMEAAVSGLRTPFLHHLILHNHGYIHGESMCSAWARIVNRQLTWSDSMRLQERWSLSLHSTEGICLQALDSEHGDVDIRLKTFIKSVSETVAQSITGLQERTQQRIVELHVIMEPDIDGNIFWKDMPWVDLSTHIPNLCRLEVNEVGFHSFFHDPVHLLYLQLSVLHLSDVDLSDESSDKVSGLVVALSNREALPECEAISTIHLSSGCQLNSRTRDLLGSNVRVFFDREEVDWDPTRPLKWWGADGW
jgi:hypothetical protein